MSRDEVRSREPEASRARPQAQLPQPPSWGPKWMRGTAGFLIGALIMDMGLHVLGVRLEWYRGLDTFNLEWILAMSVLPFVAGVAVGMTYGYGGKYLAHFPPLAVLSLAYYESASHAGQLPEGVHLIPMFFFVMFVILEMEFCAFGGVIGELLIRRYHGWEMSRYRAADSEHLPEEE